MTQFGELVGDGPDDRGVCVAQAVDGDTCQQVDVLLAVGVPDVGARPRTRTRPGVPKVFMTASV